MRHLNNSKRESCILMLKPLNPYVDGTARTIKAQYHKTSISCFTRQGTFGATGVIVIYE